MIVQNMTSQNGNKVPNQFVIKLPENVTIFQSYKTVIAQNRDGKIVLDSKALEYSATTTKYLKQFLNTGENHYTACLLCLEKVKQQGEKEFTVLSYSYNEKDDGYSFTCKRTV